MRDDAISWDPFGNDGEMEIEIILASCGLSLNFRLKVVAQKSVILMMQPQTTTFVLLLSTFIATTHLNQFLFTEDRLQWS